MEKKVYKSQECLECKTKFTFCKPVELMKWCPVCFKLKRETKADNIDMFKICPSSVDNQ